MSTKVELTKNHRNALADILVSNLSAGKKYEHHIGALKELVDEKEACKTFSIALQKAGLNDARMAGNVAKNIIGTDDIYLVFYENTKI